jgi:hypothetical protein
MGKIITVRVKKFPPILWKEVVISDKNIGIGIVLWLNIIRLKIVSFSQNFSVTELLSFTLLVIIAKGKSLLIYIYHDLGVSYYFID